MIRTINHESASVTLYEDAYSRRIRVDDYSGDLDQVLKLILNALPSWTEKLIIKSRPLHADFFRQNGFSEEAFIAGYFAGTDMHFLTQYPEPLRAISSRVTEEEHIIKNLLTSPRKAESIIHSSVTLAAESDADALATLYRESFRIYPTPVHEAAHISKTLREGTVYAIIRDQGRIVSAASAEINERFSNAELTDCATATGFEGKGLMRALLLELELHLHARGIRCLYTIARAESFGMNKAFYQLGYTYGGRMTKNCMIYSGMEDMNVWYKFDNSVI
jgi:putative beta-lysine N-acetyltransferase